MIDTLVFSADEGRFGKFQYFSLVSKNTRCQIRGYLGQHDNVGVQLGDYTTHERAIKVFKMLCDSCANNEKMFKLPYNYECDEMGI